MTPRQWEAIIGGLVAGNLLISFGPRKVEPETRGTCSHAIRTLFRTNTKAGRVALRTFWAGFSVWALPHWCNQPSLLARITRFVATVDDAHTFEE